MYASSSSTQSSLVSLTDNRPRACNLRKTKKRRESRRHPALSSLHGSLAARLKFHWSFTYRDIQRHCLLRRLTRTRTEVGNRRVQLLLLRRSNWFHSGSV